MTRARNTADTQTASGGPVSPNIAGKNAIINGGFDIAQRGTSGTFTTNLKAFCFDRWYFASATGMSIAYSQQASTIAGTRYCARVGRTAGNTNTTNIALAQDIETSNSIIYAGQTVTISFYARAGANFSAASGALTHYAIQGTGTDQSDYGAGMTGRTVLSTGTATLTTSWQRFSYTATVAASTTELNFQTSYVPVGTAGANDYYEITGVQFELGSVATPFSRAGGTYQGELALCQRYYHRRVGSTMGSQFSFGMAPNSTTIAQTYFQHPVQMRIAPTAIEASGIGCTDEQTAYTTGATTWDGSDTWMTHVRYTHGSAALTAYRSYKLYGNGTSAYLAVSAEL